MTQPAILLLLPFAGLMAGGLRPDAAWAVAGVLLASLSWRAAPRGWTPASAAWAAWAGWCLLSALAGSQPLRALPALSRAVALAVFWRLAETLWGEAERKAWPALLGISAAALIVASPFSLESYPWTGLLFPYYNYNAFILAGAFGAGLGMLGHPGGPRGRPRWLWAALMAACLAWCALARSRGGLVAAGAATLAWAVRGRHWRALAGVTVLAAAGFAAAPRPALERLFKVGRSESSHRPRIWAAALAVAAEHPLLGEGPGGFETGFLRHNFPAGKAGNYGFRADYAHSEPLHAAAETGWPGLALLAGAVALGLRGRRHTPEGAAALWAWAAMTAHLAMDNMLHMPALALVYLSAAACAGSPAAARAGPAVWRPLAAAAAILAAVAWIPARMVRHGIWAYEGIADPDARVAALRRAVRIHPGDPYPRELLARALLRTAPPRVPEALGELEAAARLHPTSGLIPGMQAEVFWLIGRPEAAMEFTSRALRLEPNFLRVRLLRAEIHAAAGRAPAARVELEEYARRLRVLKSLEQHSGYDKTVTWNDAARYRRLRLTLPSAQRP